MEYSTNILGNQGTSTIALPDFGYNTITGDKSGLKAGDFIAGRHFYNEQTIEIIRLPRKGDPDYPGGKGKPKSEFDKSGADIALDFRDNSMGTYQGMDFGTNWSVKKFPWAGNTWSYGFEVQCFYSDIEEHPDDTKH